MDPETIGRLGGWIGVIVGGIGGIVGGVIGTYFMVKNIKNTKSPRERGFVIKASIIGWILVIAFVAAMLLIPTWYKHLLWIPYAILLILGIRFFNKTQFRIRNEESGDAA